MGTLAWQDHLVVGLYLVGMLAMGAWISRRQVTQEDYFLAGRRMPWMAVGLSVIASLLSSLTYISEPGEVFKSGVTNMAGKMAAIPFEMLLVWTFVIPFLMRLRYTSIYEYLEDRFGLAARRLGVALFICLVVFWMGFVVLTSSRVLASVTQMPLVAVIATCGVIATVYTFLGGLRAVIWTDVLQVIWLIGGAILTIGFIAVQTNSTPLDWYQTIDRSPTDVLRPISFDPFARATIVTVALNMFVWHICTHTANQMTVQHYLATADVKSARRSFVAGSLWGVAINLLLLVVGLALFHFYAIMPGAMPSDLDPKYGDWADQVYCRFVVDQLPPGLSGAVLAALLAAAMSSIDSGINSLATVLTIERQRHSVGAESVELSHDLRHPRQITVAAGLFITLAAYALDRVTRAGNIVEMMPRSFNCFTSALGGLFFAGMLLPRLGQRGAVIATLCGLATSISLAYSQELFGLEQRISFTWVMPCSLAVTLAVALACSLTIPRRATAS